MRTPHAQFKFWRPPVRRTSKSTNANLDGTSKSPRAVCQWWYNSVSGPDASEPHVRRDIGLGGHFAGRGQHTLTRAHSVSDLIAS